MTDLSIISPLYPDHSLKLEKTIKLGVLASGKGSNFGTIAQCIKEGKINGQLQVLIYNNPSAGVTHLADEYDVSKVLLNHREYESREDLDRAIVKVLQEYEVDLLVMAGWMRVVTPVLISAFPKRAINIHPSLLPSFKGIHAVEQALSAKVKITGCTVHYVSSEVDSGEIIIQSAVPILPDDTSDSLHQRIQVQEHQIMPMAINIVAKELGF